VVGLRMGRRLVSLGPIPLAKVNQHPT